MSQQPRAALDKPAKAAPVAAGGASVAQLVERFIQLEHFLEQLRRRLLLGGAFFPHPEKIEEILNATDRLAQGTERVVQFR